MNPLHDRNIISHKPHWICKVFGHKYKSVVWIDNNMSITGYSVCERCGDVFGATTFEIIQPPALSHTQSTEGGE